MALTLRALALSLIAAGAIASTGCGQSTVSAPRAASATGAASTSSLFQKLPPARNLSSVENVLELDALRAYVEAEVTKVHPKAKLIWMLATGVDMNGKRTLKSRVNFTFKTGTLRGVYASVRGAELTYEGNLAYLMEGGLSNLQPIVVPTVASKQAIAAAKESRKLQGDAFDLVLIQPSTYTQPIYRVFKPGFAGFSKNVEEVNAVTGRPAAATAESARVQEAIEKLKQRL